MSPDGLRDNTRPFSQDKASDPPRWDRSIEILAISAMTKRDLAEKLKSVSAMPAPDFEMISKIARQSRDSYKTDAPFRLLMVLQSQDSPARIFDSALNQLSGAEPGSSAGPAYRGQGEPDGSLAFVFPGQGSQYLYMGADLKRCFPEAEAVLAGADQAFDSTNRLQNHIYPADLEPGGEKKRFDEALRSTDVAQPAIGAISLAMMRILNRFNIRPDATAGHSFGELTALCSAGRIDDDSFLSLAVARGKFMADAGGSDRGRMLAVKAPLSAIDTLIAENEIDAILANRNSPDQGVVSGSSEAIGKMKELCRKSRMRTLDLPVSAAFHSRLVENAAAPFKSILQTVSFSKSKIPVYSNTTGMPYPADAQGARELLGNHLLNPVNFMDGINRMYQDGVRTFIEVGPKTVLTGLIKAILGDTPFHALSMDASAGRRQGLADLAHTLCALSAFGFPVAIDKWQV